MIAVLFARGDSHYKAIPGCDVWDIVLGEATHTISSRGRRRDGSRSKARPEVTKAEREHTPPQLAAWLVELAGRCAK